MINEWTRGCVAEGITGDFTLAASVKLAPGTNGNYGGIAGYTSSSSLDRNFSLYGWKNRCEEACKNT